MPLPIPRSDPWGPEPITTYPKMKHTELRCVGRVKMPSRPSHDVTATRIMFQMGLSFPEGKDKPIWNVIPNHIGGQAGISSPLPGTFDSMEDSPNGIFVIDCFH